MIPPLPTKILHHIIKLSLPVVSFGSYRQRYDLLLVFSLVNSTWRALARKELYEKLFVRTPRQAAVALLAEPNVTKYFVGRREMFGVRPWAHCGRLARFELPKTTLELRTCCVRVDPEDMSRLSRKLRSPSCLRPSFSY
jgi:hypothetical protein